MRFPLSRTGSLVARWSSSGREHERHAQIGIPAAVMPGNAVGNAVIFQGLANGFSIYNSVIIFRIVLSWFPQLPRQFPILKPVFTVTDPYLNFFRRQIPGSSIGLLFFSHSHFLSFFLCSLHCLLRLTKFHPQPLEGLTFRPYLHCSCLISWDKLWSRWAPRSRMIYKSSLLI